MNFCARGAALAVSPGFLPFPAIAGIIEKTAPGKGRTMMITNEMKQSWARQTAAIAKRAGALILNSKIGSVTEKGGSANVVTDIDVKCQQFVVEECLKLLPQSCILAEEGEARQISDRFTWVIDPIDGTTNYLYDYHHSCVSIALYYQKKGVVGVVYDPYLDECFVGIEGVGSTCNGKELRVTGNSLENALVMTGTSPYDKTLADKTFGIMKELFLNSRDIRRSGSAALDLCYLAGGRIDAFYEHTLQPWDYAAGAIIVRGAHGTVEAMTEHSLDELQPTGILASNGSCHAALRDIVCRFL